MDKEIKDILNKLRLQRSNCMCLLENNNITDDTYKGAELVANIQTAITGILQEEILELQLKQPKKKTGSGGASFITFQNN